MFNKKEIIAIIIVTLVLGFTISLLESLNAFLIAALMIFLIIIINVFAKKVASFYLDSEIETRIWEMRRYGYKAHRHFKKPFPAGAFFPIILTAITLGYTTWLAPLVFEVKPKVYRAAKRRGIYKFSEMTEWHIGLIAAAGIFANLIFAIVGYLIGQPEFAKLSIYFAAFNMIPFSDLDGCKLFFGSIILWSFLAAVTLVGLGYAFLLI